MQLKISTLIPANKYFSITGINEYSEDGKPISIVIKDTIVGEIEYTRTLQGFMSMWFDWLTTLNSDELEETFWI